MYLTGAAQSSFFSLYIVHVEAFELHGLVGDELFSTLQRRAWSIPKWVNRWGISGAWMLGDAWITALNRKSGPSYSLTRRYPPKKI